MFFKFEISRLFKEMLNDKKAPLRQIASFLMITIFYTTHLPHQLVGENMVSS
jgi:hypothetical protein